MGKFDHLSKLEIASKLRQYEGLPQVCRGKDLYLLSDRLAELEEMERDHSQNLEQNRWSADMLQKIQAHDEVMRAAREQLDQQKDSVRRSMVVSIVAALAAVASAVAAFLVKNSAP